MSSPAPYTDIKTALDAAGLGVPIAYPNLVFSKPQPPTPWLAVSVTSAVLDPVDMGANAWREEGTAYIAVMVPVGSGTDVARTLAKNIANVFRKRVGSGVVYLGGSIGEGQTPPPDGIWWSLTVSVDWRYDDIST